MRLSLNKLHPFENRSFRMKDDDEMDHLVWSILTQGVLTPMVVHPTENGEYEEISGHRRLCACQKAGIETVPVLLYTLDRDAAAIALVDSNLHQIYQNNIHVMGKQHHIFKKFPGLLSTFRPPPWYNGKNYP